ncbi:MAG: Na+/H+ antiporter [Candidatus Eremiobacteraeota bacterium]|nr:Na+/H+ antiporter [Candidatus Eremiobacteraeota bacterium]
MHLLLASAAEHGSGSIDVLILIPELIVIALVAVAVKYVRLPYTIALVAAGLGIGLLKASHYLELDIRLTPAMIFTVFLPALLFEAAFNLHFEYLQRNLKPILTLAVVGLILATALVGFGLQACLGMTLGSALVFGALICATDPISVLAIFKEMKAPPRLAMIVEGESLLNDGAAVVVFKILLGLALGAQFSLFNGLSQFLIVSLGGLALGSAFGYFISRVTQMIDDHLIEITLSTILAYGSFLMAEYMHVSGVMAVIAAGLVYGNFGLRIGMSHNTQMMMHAFWEYTGFLMNSLVFLLIGTQVDLRLIADEWYQVLVAFVVVVAARGVAVFLLTPICNQFDTPVISSWQCVIVWAGLRGSVSMALAMGLPPELENRQEILLMTFGVVILSLFVQGLTTRNVLAAFGLLGRSPRLYDYEVKLGQMLSHERALKELARLRKLHSINPDIYEQLAAPHRHSMETLQQELKELGRTDQDIRDEQVQDAMRNVLAAQIAAVQDALTRGLISDDAASTLMQRLAQTESHIHELHAAAPTEDLGKAAPPGVESVQQSEEPAEN